MKKFKFSNEIKTGTVVVAAILIALFFWLRTSNFQTATYSLKTYFGHAEGVKENSVVSLAGIEVGRVGSLRFVYGPDETKVELDLLVDKNAKVREDSIAFIGSTGFIGDAYVGITPGNSNVFLKNNATITSEDPVEMRKLMKKADEIAGKLDSVLGDVKTIVADNKSKVNSIVANLEETTANFNEFSADIKAHPWKLLMKGKEKKR
ncbi:MAG: MCE family protein [Candidatus Omnitrophica bacterium]|nr:MCE family protein [Candidatus Omnitrophota bacterium]